MNIRIKQSLLLIAIIIFNILPGMIHNVLAFDSYIIHPSLAREIAAEYNKQPSNRLLSSEEIEWLTQGTLEEDEPAIRVLNHFYNPITKGGLHVGGLVLGLPATDWILADRQQKIHAGGDCSWPTAITSYQTGDTAKAFRCLGHVLHLIEDMGVPAHTRNDQHLIGDPFEQWAKYHNPSAVQRLTSQPDCHSAKECIISLSTWINKNFVSKNTINSHDFVEPFNSATIIGDYLVNNDIKLATFNPKNKSFILTEEIQAEYWQAISPVIVSYGNKLLHIFFSEVNVFEKDIFQRQHTTVSVGNQPSLIPSHVSQVSPIVTLSPQESLLPVKPPIIPLVLDKIEAGIKKIIPIPDLINPLESITKLTSSLPDTYITKRPASTTRERTADFIFASDKIGVTFQCSYNAIVWFSCASEYKHIDLQPGRQFLLVRAVSNAGVDTTPIYYSWVIDMTPPDTWLLSFTNPNTREAEFRFGSDVGSHFECQIDTNGWKECVSPQEYENLSSGHHIFQVRASDQVGNFEIIPAISEWTITMLQPIEPVINFPEIFPYVTNQSTVLFQGQKESELSLLVNNSTQGVEQSRNVWSYHAFLIPGQNNFLFKGVNVYDEASEVLSREVIFDVTPPLVSVVSLPEYHHGENFVVEWVAEDEFSDTILFDIEYRLGAGEWQVWYEKTSLTEAVFMFSNTNQDIFLRLRGYDQAGNSSNWLESHIVYEVLPVINTTDHIVISQIMVKGIHGSQDEFIELYNPTNEPISLAHFSIQRKSKSEIIWHQIVPAVQHESFIIQPGGYFLAVSTSYSYAILPDAFVLNELLYDDNGHIRIVNNLGVEIDRLGYGQVISPETIAASQPHTGESLHRKANLTSTATTLQTQPELGNGFDSNNNFNDFVLQTVVFPKNSLYQL